MPVLRLVDAAVVGLGGLVGVPRLLSPHLYHSFNFNDMVIDHERLTVGCEEENPIKVFCRTCQSPPRCIFKPGSTYRGS